jgi:hypothetical protein
VQALGERDEAKLSADTLAGGGYVGLRFRLEWSLLKLANVRESPAQGGVSAETPTVKSTVLGGMRFSGNANC